MISSHSAVLSLFAGALFLLHNSPYVASFSVSRNGKSFHSIGKFLSVSFSADEMPELHHPNRIAEFRDLEPIVESDIRRSRMKQDRKLRRRFAKHGDDLWALRKVTKELSKNLVEAINHDSREKEESIREQLRQLEGQDPELVYKTELQKMRRAWNEGRDENAEEHGRNALAARSQLPQYNLDGLWVGK